MLHIRISTQRQLLALLQRIETHKKTGRLIITHPHAKKELYSYQGHIVAIVATDRREEALIRRLVRAKLLSLDDLQRVPANIGHVLSQLSQNAESYSDVKIAKIVMKLGLVHHQQLLDWIEQETTAALQQLLMQPLDNASFEEGIQPPSGHLCTFLIERLATPSPLIPETPHPIQVEPPYIDHIDTKPEMAIVPKSSGFIRLPKVIVGTQTYVQRAVSALRSFPLPDYPLTARVATPPRPNPLLRWEILLVIVLLLIAGLAHGVNMFHYPYFEDDEGTYISQAWAVVHLGRLAYYTYWYDHAPVGWIQIAIWTVLSGGFHTFGSALASGRVLMLLMQLGSTVMLYRITRCISHNVTVSIMVCLLFALSPFGIYYHRRVLLDNIATFSMLLSLLLIFSQQISLRRIFISAFVFGISVLSKEVTVFLVPAVIYLVFYRADKLHRMYATIGWIALFTCVVSAYPLMAILKNELFPVGTWLGGNAPHVSLLGAIAAQAVRKKDAGLFYIHSGFYIQTASWLRDEPVLVGGGTVCALLSILLIKWHRFVGIVGLLSLSFWAFLARGGELIVFYLVPLLPLLALNIGLIVGILAKSLTRMLRSQRRISSPFGRVLEQVLIIGCVAGIVVGLSGPSLGFNRSNVSLTGKSLWSSNQADAQAQAVVWIEHHLPKQSSVIIDEYMWTDLYDSGYTRVHYYWKVQDDPAIRDSLFHNDWHNFDYIATTPQVLADMQSNDMTLVKDVYAHSSSLASFTADGWGVDIRKVNK